MLVIPPPQNRGRAKRIKAIPLLLMRATYTDSGPLNLTFNQPVDIAAFDGSQVEVDDGPGGRIYTGSNAFLLGPRTVRINLVPGDVTTGSLTVSATSDVGIKALIGKQTWGGCESMPLPFP